MMSKKKSGKFEKIKFASMIPLILVMLFAFNPADANLFEDLEKGKKVFGKVISEDGKALPGVKIKIDGEDKGATDLMGNYEIPLSGSNESIEFTFPGFSNYSSEIPKNGRLNVTLKKGSSTYKTNEAAFFPRAKVIKKSGISYLVGSVTDKDGNPLKGIDVLVPMQKIKTSTDEDGEFKLQLNMDTGRAIFGIPEKGGEYRKVVPLEFGN